MTTFKEFSQLHVPEIDKTINQFLTVETTEEKLLKAMLYSINAGGKRFRPLLLLSTLDFLNYSINKESYQLAASLEMIHCYSLIHDDLPAMDDDDLRRGKPTNHKVYGEAVAILAGDGLLTEAFHLLAVSGIEPVTKTVLLAKLAKASGINGMISGQVMDMENEDKKIELNTLQLMHRRKTGALIEYAVSAGCQLADADSELYQFLTDFSVEIGIAFQIRDDLLDVVGNEKALGKRIGADLEHQKSTYVSLLGLSKAKEAFELKCQAAQTQLNYAKKRAGIVGKTMLDDILEELMVI
ncbi:polyprenyl synthetase family protein [Vagococcus vulneris]|uniref:Farnesyl diphosphate synthase n=1 Tax=Vagococcus vulneris TaxID=1977869 RepID=A0A429ZW73_9ENTE|nr:farnesyl diphosphate synthase [Vagococcus vulneris]RST98049.1 hypothetical protein CBF37_09095 [Vagococcus vulneris]